MSQRCFIHSGETKAWFSYIGKIPDDRGFYFVPTIPDFADISDIRQRSVPDFPDYEFGRKSLVKRDACLFVIGGLEPSNLGD